MKPKSSKVLNGDQALAWGALAGGIKMVTSYPGSPSSNTVEILIGLAKEHDLYVEWSSNERVALELDQKALSPCCQLTVFPAHAEWQSEYRIAEPKN